MCSPLIPLVKFTRAFRREIYRFEGTISIGNGAASVVMATTFSQCPIWECLEIYNDDRNSKESYIYVEKSICGKAKRRIRAMNIVQLTNESRYLNFISTHYLT